MERKHQADLRGMVTPIPPRSDGLPMTERAGQPHPDAEGVSEELIRELVVEFYQRARHDERLGPVFAAHVEDWDGHLARMADFWSAALRRSGRYSGKPVERHRSIEGLSQSHFGRWIELFEATARDLCSPREAEAFLTRARRMHDGMTRVLGLDDPVEPDRENSTQGKAQLG